MLEVPIDKWLGTTTLGNNQFNSFKFVVFLIDLDLKLACFFNRRYTCVLYYNIATLERY